MKITIYTTSTCSFSAAEKAYLQSRNLPFEEKNVETSKENLEELLKVGNNFAGTPVTKIEKDDGKVIILKGFTKEEVEKELPLAPGAPAAPASTPDMSVPQMPQVSETTPPVQMPDMPPVPQAPQAPVAVDPVVSQVMSTMAPQQPTVTFDPAPMNPPATQEPAPMYQPQTPMAPAMPEPAMPTMSFEPPMAQAPSASAPSAQPTMPVNDPLDSILKDLQSKVGSPVMPSVTAPSPTTQSDMPGAVMPSIPDFPAK
jgi:glutaredoxin